MFVPVLVGSALVALVVALAIRLSCKMMYGAAPSYGNAWLGAFAGAVAGSVLTPLLMMMTGFMLGAPLLTGVAAFLVQAAVFKKVLVIEGRGQLSFGESSLMALVAALLLVILMPLAKFCVGGLFLMLASFL